MSKLKYVIIVTLLAIPAWWALRAQTSRPATLTAVDYIEIQQLVARYPYAVDMHGGDGSAYAALFAPDGSFGTQAKGTALLAELAAKTNKDRSGPAFTRHFVTNVVIKPAPEGATGRSYLVALDISEGGKPTTILHGGHYDDVYVKTPQGWRIKSRTYVRSEIGPQQ
jgi:actinorhodin biosynthesis protein ActVIA